MDIKIDRVSKALNNLYNNFNNFKLVSMQEFKSMNKTIHSMFDYVRKGYHSSDHDTNIYDASDMPVDKENAKRYHQFSANEGDIAVQYVTPLRRHIVSHD
ncbi:hypothetical protein FNV43_RR10463 [Rhamnella rubrinervis]|uniref:Uncharacterized protein n=1 Tax=Rhamnella rubrinervis TaxID=2594499 RepID=A0A8K0HBV5_9ROSA|nr:hypothetical protein FNV43_RR10463 [Rhamnella rubrinervis]